MTRSVRRVVRRLQRPRKLQADDPSAEVGVTFTAGMLGPFLGVEIASHEDEIPDDGFGRVLEALSECPKFSVNKHHLDPGKCTGHNLIGLTQMNVGGAGSVKPLQKAARVTMNNLNGGRHPISVTRPGSVHSGTRVPNTTRAAVPHGRQGPYGLVCD